MTRRKKIDNDMIEELWEKIHFIPNTISRETFDIYLNGLGFSKIEKLVESEWIKEYHRLKEVGGSDFRRFCEFHRYFSSGMVIDRIRKNRKGKNTWERFM